MDVDVELAELSRLHPRLEWQELIAAAAIVLGEKATPPFDFEVEIVDLPTFEDDLLHLAIHAAGLSSWNLAKRRRTFEPSRLVELAAIALAGLTIYHAGGRTIGQVAACGTAADYVLEGSFDLMEVTGRSRRRDFETAWRRHWQNLNESAGSGFYLFAADFETPKGRLQYHS